MIGGSGNGFWSPTENKPAMRAFAQSLRDRGQGARRRRSWPRMLVELVAVAVVAAGIFVVVSALA